MKVKYKLLVSFVFGLSACGEHGEIISKNQEKTHFITKNIKYNEPVASPSSGHMLSKEEINSLPEAEPSFRYMQGQPTIEQKHTLYYPNIELSAKHVPVEDYSKYSIQPGLIEVVLKDEYYLRIDNETNLKLISHSNTQAAEELNQYLTSMKLTALYDMAGDMSEAEVQEDLKRIKSFYDGDIPTRYSIQTYSFPENTDLLPIIKKLRTLPYVRAANFVYYSELSVTKTLLGTTNNHATNPANNGSPPSDPDFSTPSEENNWWWYQRHKVFAGWTLWDQVGTPQPTIAVIDSGFDTAAPADWDKPSYLTGRRFNGCTSPTSCSTIDTTVTEPTHPGLNKSHGTIVASLAASPRNNGYRYAGIAPGANIYPIRVMENTGATILSPNVAAGIRHAASLSNVDVITISISSGGNACPASNANSMIRTEIASAISAGKIVVASAGNHGSDLQNQPAELGYPYPPGTLNPCVLENNIEYSSATGGEIIVGGIASDTVPAPKRTKGWYDYPSSASNYDTNAKTTISRVDLAAAAAYVLVPIFNPNTNTRTEDHDYGTSLATPMVAATAGMMKKIAQHSSGGIPSITLSHSQIRNLLVGAADVSRYTGGYTSDDEERFLGENLDYQMGRMVGVRSLNVHNSLLLARYTKMYPIIVRLHNADDIVQFTHNNDWTTPARKDLSYGYDSFWGVSGINPGNTLNFRTYNAFVSGYAYGYSIFRYNNFWAQSFAGVSGIAGAELNASKPVGYYGGFNFTY